MREILLIMEKMVKDYLNKKMVLNIKEILIKIKFKVIL